MFPRMLVPLSLIALLLAAASVVAASPSPSEAPATTPALPGDGNRGSEAASVPVAAPVDVPAGADSEIPPTSAIAAALLSGAAAISDGIAVAATALAGAFGSAFDAILAGFVAVGSGLAFAGRLLADGAIAAAAGVAAFVAWLASAPGAVLDWYAGLSPGAQQAVAYSSAGTAAAGAGAGAWVWVRRAATLGFLAPLYTRIRKSEALDNDQRAAIYAHVRDAPGAHPSAIKSALGIGWGTTVYHLETLQELGLVTSKKAGINRCFFVNGGVSRDDQASIGALKNATASAIARYLHENAGATQKDVASSLGLSAALVSWHVKRLVDAGVLAKERVGRGTSLTVVASAGILVAP